MKKILICLLLVPFAAFAMNGKQTAILNCSKMFNDHFKGLAKIEYHNIFRKGVYYYDFKNKDLLYQSDHYYKIFIEGKIVLDSITVDKTAQCWADKAGIVSKFKIVEFKKNVNFKMA